MTVYQSKMHLPSKKIADHFGSARYVETKDRAGMRPVKLVGNLSTINDAILKEKKMTSIRKNMIQSIANFHFNYNGAYLGSDGFWYVEGV